jgi:undecaprenyl-diphosphatase
MFPLAFALIAGATYLAGALLLGSFPNGVQVLDRAGMDAARELRSAWLTTVAVALTSAGDAEVVTIVLGSALVGAAIARSRPWVGFFSLAFVGAFGIHNLVKPLVGRERPALDPLVEIGGYAFPSGHATAGAVLYGALIVVAVVKWGPRRGGLAGALLVAIALGVGLSRIYLGVHWPTDVAAGLIAGGTWVYVATRLSGVLHEPRA